MLLINGVGLNRNWICWKIVAETSNRIEAIDLFAFFTGLKESEEVIYLSLQHSLLVLECR